MINKELFYRFHLCLAESCNFANIVKRIAHSKHCFCCFELCLVFLNFHILDTDIIKIIFTQTRNQWDKLNHNIFVFFATKDAEAARMPLVLSSHDVLPNGKTRSFHCTRMYDGKLCAIVSSGKTQLLSYNRFSHSHLLQYLCDFWRFLAKKIKGDRVFFYIFYNLKDIKASAIASLPIIATRIES